MSPEITATLLLRNNMLILSLLVSVSHLFVWYFLLKICSLMNYIFDNIYNTVQYF